jgi:hypothetical protein
MIQVRLSNGDFLFGIDAENVKRLQAGDPMVFDMTKLGGTDKLLIMYGDTMADIVKELEDAMGPLPPAQPMPADNTPQ